MKKLTILILASLFLQAKLVTIIDNGIKRVIELPDKDNLNTPRGVDTSLYKKEIILAFKKDKKVDIKSFEKKYNLKLKKHLLSGYYIFINNSNLSDIELIYKISKENSNIIKTIRPNWGFNNKPR